jgi:hypothetical protein
MSAMHVDIEIRDPASSPGLKASTIALAMAAHTIE